MRNLFVIGLFLSVVLFSCKPEQVEPEPQPQPEPVSISAIGVWQNGNYFFSLNSEGFLTSYIAQDFIDCGTISQTNDSDIVCNNTYFVRNTLYKVKYVDSETMELEIHYKSVLGEELSTEVTLYKTDKIPVLKENPIVGKSYGYLSQYFGNVTYQFQTFQTALKSGHGNATNYPLSLYYVFFNNHVYYQAFNVVNVSPSIGAWNQHVGEGKISVIEVNFGPDGSITSFIDVTESML